MTPPDPVAGQVTPEQLDAVIRLLEANAEPPCPYLLLPVESPLLLALANGERDRRRIGRMIRRGKV
jgi:hypothetical protein